MDGVYLQNQLGMLDPKQMNKEDPSKVLISNLKGPKIFTPKIVRTKTQIALEKKLREMNHKAGPRETGKNEYKGTSGKFAKDDGNSFLDSQGASKWSKEFTKRKLANPVAKAPTLAEIGTFSSIFFYFMCFVLLVYPPKKRSVHGYSAPEWEYEASLTDLFAERGVRRDDFEARRAQVDLRKLRVSEIGT